MSDKPTTGPAATPPPPTPEYDTWNADQIKSWAATVGQKVRNAAIAYETAHQNRPEVIAALSAP
jgi:hypothetical protein